MRLIAHRGASDLAPENTLAAFRLALELGAEALELDVHQTADKELVVIHDDDLLRTAGRRELVRDLAWPELRRFDVGSWFDARFKGELVPGLDEVFDLVGRRADIHVEVKAGSGLYPGIEGRLVEFLRRRKALKSCVVSSFDHKALFVLRGLEPRLRLGYLLGPTPLESAWQEMAGLRAESLNFGLKQVAPARVAAGHCRRHKILVYTVNDARQARRLKDMGVDGIFSNFPRLLEKDA